MSLTRKSFVEPRGFRARGFEVAYWNCELVNSPHFQDEELKHDAPLGSPLR